MTNTQKMIMDFVDSIEYAEETKKFIKDNLPEWIEKMEQVFERNPNDDASQKTVLSYTLLSMVIKMRDLYLQGKHDGFEQLIESNEK